MQVFNNFYNNSLKYYDLLPPNKFSKTLDLQLLPKVVDFCENFIRTEICFLKNNILHKNV